jgi:hypothetical protein
MISLASQTFGAYEKMPTQARQFSAKLTRQPPRYPGELNPNHTELCIL